MMMMNDMDELMKKKINKNLCINSNWSLICPIKNLKKIVDCMMNRPKK